MTITNYKNILLTLLAGLGLLIPTNTRAQLLQASLSHYSTDDGMPSNTIAALASDDYGYLWIATWNGISRFDGFTFYNYKTGIASGIRGMHNRVDNLIVDQGQNIWLKMYDGRMFVINRKTDRIEDPMEGVSGKDNMHMDYFFTPYVTSAGDVLVSYGDMGLYKLRLDRTGIKQDVIMTGQLTVQCVVEGYHDDLWVGTDKGVHRVDMANLSIEKKGYFLDENVTRLATNGYIIYAGTKSGKILQFAYGQEPTLVKDLGREITGLYVDSRGLIWFSDLGDGAYRLDTKTGDVKMFKQILPSPEFTSRGAEFNEALGVLWVRMNHGGYGYYNRETDEIEYFHNDPSNPWNLSNTVNASLEMNDGVVWESTNRRGLEKLEVMKRTIERRMLMHDAQSPMENETRAMCYDKKRHRTLIANKKGTIFVFDDNGTQVATISHDSQGNPMGRAYGMTTDSKGNYWVCDKDKGVYKITPQQGGGYNVVNIHHDDNNEWSMSHNAAYQAKEDKQGNIWVATYGGGINILQQNKEGKYIAYNAKNKLAKYPRNKHQKVRTIEVDKEGNVWAGTTDGILIMSFKNNNFTCEEMKVPEKMDEGLMSYDIVMLARDPQGTMWVATNSGGLSQAREKDDDGAWLFDSYGIESGLPSEEIHSMTFDEKGNIWFTTDHVICSFDKKKKIFTTFSQLDGVDDTMTSEGAAMLGPNNNIYFGTLSGYYIVDRKKLKTTTGSLLKLRITDFLLDKQLQTPRLTDKYDYYIPESKRVKIPAGYEDFAFVFAALNYQLQHRVVYQYKLDGYEEEWHNADNRRTAVYENVPGGTYRFQVKAFLLESPEAYDMRTIEVVVEGRFWTSWIAQIIYFILLGVLIFYGRKWLKHYQELRALDAEQQAKRQEEEEGATDEYELIDDNDKKI